MAVADEPSHPRSTRVDLVTPVFNEAETIEATLSAFLEAADENDIDLRIVVSEDGSTDETRPILENMTQRDPRITVLEGASRKGYSQAALDGLRAARAPLVAFCDSDGQYEAADLPKLVEQTSQADLVVGWRNPRKDHWLRLVMSRLFSIPYRWLFKIQLRDPSSPYLVTTNDAIREALPCDGPLLDQGFWWEFYARANSSQFRMAEIPITHLARHNGGTKVYSARKLPGIIFRHLRGLVRLRRELNGAATTRPTTAPRLRATLGIALFLLVFAIPTTAAFREPADPMDEGLLLAYPERILEGDMPHKDFEQTYAPMTTWTLAAVFAATDPSVETERTVGLAYRALIVIALFLLFRSQGGNPWLGAAAASLLLLSSGAMALAWWGAVACATCALALTDRVLGDERRERTIGAFVAGALLTLALSFRQDLVVGVLGAAIPLVMSPRRKLKKPFLYGLAIGLAPLVIHLMLIGPHDFFSGMVFDPVIRERGGRVLPISLADVANIVGLLACIAVVLVTRGRRLNQRIVGMSFAFLMVGLLPQYLQRVGTHHFILVAALPLSAVIAAVTPVKVRSDKAQRGMRKWRVTPTWKTNGPRVLGALVMVTFVWAALATFLSYIESPLIRMETGEAKSYNARNNGRTFPLATPSSQEATNDLLERYGDIPRGSRLLVGPTDLTRTNYSDTFLYYLIPQAEPASYYMEMNPGGANGDPRFAAELASADILILNEDYDSWREPNSSRDPGLTAPMKVVEDSFCQVDEFGPYHVYKRRPAHEKCVARSA